MLMPINHISLSTTYFSILTIHLIQYLTDRYPTPSTSFSLLFPTTEVKDETASPPLHTLRNITLYKMLI